MRARLSGSFKLAKMVLSLSTRDIELLSEFWSGHTARKYLLYNLGKTEYCMKYVVYDKKI